MGAHARREAAVRERLVRVQRQRGLLVRTPGLRGCFPWTPSGCSSIRGTARVLLWHAKAPHAAADSAAERVRFGLLACAAAMSRAWAWERAAQCSNRHAIGSLNAHFHDLALHRTHCRHLCWHHRRPPAACRSSKAGPVLGEPCKALARQDHCEPTTAREAPPTLP